MDSEVGVLGKIFSENGLDSLQTDLADINPNINGRKPRLFADVHQLISQASARLAEIEISEATKCSLDKNGDDSPLKLESQHQDSFNSLGYTKAVECDMGSSADETEGCQGNEHGLPRRGVSYLHYVLIKRMNKYYCSECAFSTKLYKTFFGHFKRVHSVDIHNAVSPSKQLQSPSNRNACSSDLKYMYRCSLCPFVTRKLQGFKIHSAYKHSKYSYTKIMRYVPMTHPKAKTYYLAYIQSMKEGAQKKQVLAQFQYCFQNDKTKLKTKKLNLRKLHKSLKNGIAQDTIPCMHCGERCAYPSLLEKHYSDKHGVSGPWRNEEDQLFHCEKCPFTSVGYRPLHHHFAENHNQLEATSKTVNSENKFVNGAVGTTETTLNGQSNFPETKINGDIRATTILDVAQTSKCLESDSDDRAGRAIISNHPTQRVLLCDRCRFTSPSICAFLNHYRVDHNRHYPTFVVNRILQIFMQNLVMVEIPRRTLVDDWISGWMNEECTGIIIDPMYSCQLCEYESPVLNTITTHYNHRHPNYNYSVGRIGVKDAVESRKKRAVCSRGNKLFRCAECAYTTVFYQTILNHYRTLHNDINLSDEELGSIIYASTVEWCVKCNASFRNVGQLLQHIEEKHYTQLPNFSLTAAGMFDCGLCETTLHSSYDLLKHLEEHIKINVNEFDRHTLLAYCCSKCRRVFKGERFLRHHFTRMHTEWSEKSFAFSEIPDKFLGQNGNQIMARQTTSGRIYQSLRSPAATITGLSENVSQAAASPFQSIEYTCAWCPFHTRSGVTMRRHIRLSHHRYVSSKRLEGLKQKENMNAKLPPGRESDVTAGMKYVKTCSHVKWISKSPAAYAKHVKMRHNSVNPFKCPHCHKHYLCQVVLVMHTKKKHKFASVPNLIDSDVKSNSTDGVCYSCLHKNKTSDSGTPYAFRRHLEIAHSLDKPYHCQQCPKKYVCSSVYLLHLRRSHHVSDAHIPINSHKKSLDVSAPSAPTTGDYLDERSSPDAASLPGRPRINPTYPLQKKSIGSVKRKQSKDYAQPRSVRVAPGKWKCVYCKQKFPLYPDLRKHMKKMHPTKQLLKCRWCDYTCKTHIQLSKHGRIHIEYIGTRMKELRHIWHHQKMNGLESLNKRKHYNQIESVLTASAHLQGSEVGETNLNVTPEAEESLDETKSASEGVRTPQRARKSICNSSTRVEMSTQSTTSSSLHDGYHLFKDGRLACKFCSHMTIDRARMLIHLRAKHATLSNFKCQLCSFIAHNYDDIRQHLTEHHKMEKNHYLAIDFSVNINAEEKLIMMESEQPRGPGRPPKNPRPLIFAPQPSLDTIAPSDDFVDDFSTRIKSIALVPRFGMTRAQSSRSSDDVIPRVMTRQGSSNGSSNVRPTSERFKCKYCRIETLSTYEMEYHMRRHEIAAVETTRFGDHQQILSQLTSLSSARSWPTNFTM